MFGKNWRWRRRRPRWSYKWKTKFTWWPTRAIDGYTYWLEFVKKNIITDEIISWDEWIERYTTS